MTLSTDLLRTPLHDWHARHGGRMVDFAGWSMPVQYTSIAEEHHATRNAVGVFDISHMGRLCVSGRGDSAGAFVDQLVTRRITDMKTGQVRYALVCNESGGILDDVLVYRGASNGIEDFPIVVNASNRSKIVDRIERQIKGCSDTGSSINLADNTFETAMIAVQGPKSIDVLSSFVQPVDARFADLRSLRYYFATPARFQGAMVLTSRTGYTGEDGCEIICDKASAPEIWEQIIAAATAVGGMAAGLGARDTLRLEAAMPLYGHELTEAINPIQAGLNFAINLSGRDFVGREALERLADDRRQPVRIGLQVEGKRVARQGCPVLQGNEIVGEVTSGTFSPTFERSIAMAYVRPTAQAIGTRLAVDIRGTQHAATVVPLPFYERSRKN
jgi:aminomethyltransferase